MPRRRLAVVSTIAAFTTALIPCTAAASPTHAAAKANLAAASTTSGALAKAQSSGFKTFKSSASTPIKRQAAQGSASTVKSHTTGTGTTIYVAAYLNATTCTNGAGAGSAATPYCSIQAAVNAAVSGDTVDLLGSAYNSTESVTVSTSGISIVGIGNNVWNEGLSGVPAFVLDHVSNVTISNIVVQGNAAPAVEILGSSNITLDSDYTTGSAYAIPSSIEIDGTSSHVTVSRTYVDAGAWAKGDVGISVAAGASNITLSGDVLLASGIVATGVNGLDVVGNTIERPCTSAIDIEGTSTGVYLENNLLEDLPPYSYSLVGYKSECTAQAVAWAPDVTVAAGSTAATTTDYNDFYLIAADATAPYSWAGTTYATLPAFQAGVTQAAHDTIDTTRPQPMTFRPQQGISVFAGTRGDSAAYDSANVNAPGMLNSDFFGTSPYLSRGAVQPNDVVTPKLVVTPTAGFGVGANAGGSTVSGGSSAWIDHFTFSWGDGTQTQTQPGNSSDSGRDHTYAQAGTYEVQVTVTDSNGVSASTSTSINVVYIDDKVTAALTVKQTSAFGISADASASTGRAPIYQYSFDWGDHTAPTSVVNFTHHSYAKLGVYTVTVTVTDMYGQAATTSVVVSTAGSEYTAYGPTRLLDTRSGIGAPAGRINSGADARVQIAGNGSIPADVTAVALNITVTDTTGSGFVTAFGEGGDAPITSNVNYVAGQTVPNLAIVPVGVDGYVDLLNSGAQAGPVDLIADVTGYFTPAAAAGYTSLSPDRLIDTRNGTGVAKGQVRAGGAIGVQIAGADGGQLPASGIAAVALNVTVTGPGGSGFLTAYPDGESTPNASNVNYSRGQTIANSVVVPVGADGEIDIANGGASAAGTDIVVDVVGYYSAGSASAYLPILPFRYLDTRAASWPDGPLPNGLYLPMPLGLNTNNLDQADITGFVLNSTVTDTAGNGFLTVSPDPNTYAQYVDNTFTAPIAPNSSNLNWTTGQTVPNLVQASTGSTGIIDFWNLGGHGGNADLIVDVYGYYQND